jgi:UDP-glucose:(heptosyl)LPS alpha-1,3-glucosyltransferase
MERAHAELVRGLHRAFDVTVVSATLAEDLRPLVRWRRMNVPRRPFALKFLVFFVRAGLEVRRADSELVHTLGAIIPNRTDVASVHFCHAGHREACGALVPRGVPLLRRLNTTAARGAALLAERWCFRPGRVGTLAVVSDGVGHEVAAHYPGVPVALTPNGVDASRFHPRPDQRQAVRADLGIEPGRCVALFVGGDWDHKGLGLAIEAVAKARAEVPDLVLLVVGPGDRARFAALADRAGVSDCVRFFGRRADPERFYQAADVFVLPSAYETFSIACFEAAACGLPLVIPRLSGAGALVGDDEAGIIVNREAASIANALVRLACDPARRAALGAEAHRRATPYTWEASVASVMDIYRSRLP